LLWGQIGMSLRTFICFFVSILVSRSLDVDSFGVYSALVSLIAILLYFTGMGTYSIFNNYLPRFEGRNRLGFSSYLIRRTLFIKTVVYLIVAIGIHKYIGYLADLTGYPAVRNYAFGLMLWFFLRGTSETFLYILMSRMAMRYYTFVETTISILQLMGVLYLVQTEMNIASLIVLMIIVYGVQCVLNAYGARESYLFEPERPKLSPIVKYGLIIWFTGIVQYFLAKDVDIFLILYFLKDNSLVGFYNIAFLITTTGGYILLSSVSSLSLTILSSAYTKRGMDGLRESLGFLFKVSLVLSAPIFAFMIFQTDNIIVSLFSAKYAAASELLIVLSFFYLLAAFAGGGFMVTALLPLNMEKIVLYLRSGGGILNLILNFIFIPNFGISGAVAATGISFFVLTLFELLVVMKLSGFRPPMSFVYKLMPITVIPAALTLFLGQSGLIGLMVCAVLYGVVVLKLAFMFCPLERHERNILEGFTPKTVRLLKKCRLLKQT
jgi:O-antigen/teichoic acid export membrane protein